MCGVPTLTALAPAWKEGEGPMSLPPVLRTTICARSRNRGDASRSLRWELVPYISKRKGSV